MEKNKAEFVEQEKSSDVSNTELKQNDVENKEERKEIKISPEELIFRLKKQLTLMHLGNLKNNNDENNKPHIFKAIRKLVAKTKGIRNSLNKKRNVKKT